MVDSKRIANIIFDKGKRIPQVEYFSICESIEDDRLSLNEYVISYKKKDAILENLFFSLKDGTRILIKEEVLNKLSGLNLDKVSLVKYMSENKENFQNVMREIING